MSISKIVRVLCVFSSSEFSVKSLSRKYQNNSESVVFLWSYHSIYSAYWKGNYDSNAEIVFIKLDVGFWSTIFPIHIPWISLKKLRIRRYRWRCIAFRRVSAGGLHSLKRIWWHRESLFWVQYFLRSCSGNRVCTLMSCELSYLTSTWDR